MNILLHVHLLHLLTSLYIVSIISTNCQYELDEMTT